MRDKIAKDVAELVKDILEGFKIIPIKDISIIINADDSVNI